MIIKSKFTVTLKAENADECEAVFEFKKPKANRILALQAEDVKDDVRKQFDTIMADLVSVKGLLHEDESQVTIKQIQDLDLDLNTIVAIVAGYTLGAFPKKNEEDQEKKTSLSE